MNIEDELCIKDFFDQEDLKININTLQIREQKNKFNNSKRPRRTKRNR